MKIKNEKKLLKEVAKATFETVIYAMCYFFITLFAFITGNELIKIILNEIVIRYYICGILTITAVILSIVYIVNFNKKFGKNDSYSPKRQNDFLFESNVCR